MAIIGVMGSGQSAWEELAAPLGMWIARSGHDLLTGGGNGVMLAVSRAFADTPGRKGRCIGVLPTQPDAVRGFAPLEGYPNPYVDLRLVTPLPRREASAPAGSLSRNYINILTSDVVIALPGSAGTMDEIGLALRFAKPVMCFGPVGMFSEVPGQVKTSAQLDDVTAFISTQLASEG
ncbi:MAG: putative rossmann fold nucleotide-binding -like protein [Polaromonas sp.]|nr:putative rossmann fold nucleotide-binding -like protein [Polaromonas sp.]